MAACLLLVARNDKAKGAIIIIMQRLHEDDLAGHVLTQEAWDIVSFPAIAEADEEHSVDTLFGRKRVIRRSGEALHPERESLRTLEQICATLGTYTFPANISRPPLQQAAAWSRTLGFGATSQTPCPRASIKSSKAGTPPTNQQNLRTIPSARPGGSKARSSTFSMSCARSSPTPTSSAPFTNSICCLTRPSS